MSKYNTLISDCKYNYKLLVWIRGANTAISCVSEPITYVFGSEKLLNVLNLAWNAKKSIDTVVKCNKTGLKRLFSHVTTFTKLTKLVLWAAWNVFSVHKNFVLAAELYVIVIKFLIVA